MKMLQMMQKGILAACFAACSLCSQAQDLATRMAAFDIAIDPAATGTLSLTIDNLSFFKDNEYEGDHSRGYSLPGLWLQPKVVYQPLPNVRLEAGFHALIFDGANKYPCYAYHDIGRWKGNQYQSGAHVLPFFRAQAQLQNLTFVLGDIYGGANHHLMEPLMNTEVNLTQDPEMGFQLLWNLPRYQLDAWLNWQSYIFEEDTHQEAFTVGVHQQFLLNDPAQAWHWYLPVDVLAQHRRGEQDITDMGVQTITNGGIGLGLRWRTGARALESITAEAAALGCWQQAGELWPFDSGVAVSGSVAAQFKNGLRVFGGLFYTRDFVSLYGSPFYSTLSQADAGTRFRDLLTPHAGVEWCHTFAKDYTLGAKADIYPVRGTNNFSFGAYFRCTPSFQLWKKR